MDGERLTPTEFDLDRYSDEDLVRLWHRTVDALRRRGVCRTRNIVSDVAERLVAQKLGLALSVNSTRGYDAAGPDGTTYQVKCRLLTEWNRSKQLGDVRYLNEPRPFDFLIAVLFSDDFPNVYAAHKIPLAVVRQFVVKKGARDVLMAQGRMLTAPGVEDITTQLR